MSCRNSCRALLRVTEHDFTASPADGAAFPAGQVWSLFRAVVEVLSTLWVSGATTEEQTIEEQANTTTGQESALGFLCRGPVFGRNLTIALVVGSILSVANQLDVILRGNFSGAVLLKILFNFLVPFTVASVSCVVNQTGK